MGRALLSVLGCKEATKKQCSDIPQAAPSSVAAGKCCRRHPACAERRTCQCQRHRSHAATADELLSRSHKLAAIHGAVVLAVGVVGAALLRVGDLGDGTVKGARHGCIWCTQQRRTTANQCLHRAAASPPSVPQHDILSAQLPAPAPATAAPWWQRGGRLAPPHTARCAAASAPTTRCLCRQSTLGAALAVPALLPRRSAGVRTALRPPPSRSGMPEPFRKGTMPALPPPPLAAPLAAAPPPAKCLPPTGQSHRHSESACGGRDGSKPASVYAGQAGGRAGTVMQRSWHPPSGAPSLDQPNGNPCEFEAAHLM